MNNKIDFSKVDWQHILQRLGVDAKLIANPKKRGPCPIEQTGHTRFRFVNKDGRGNWVCNCGAGDGVRLVALIYGVSDTEAVRMIRDVVKGQPSLRQAPVRPAAQEKTPADIEKARAALKRVRRSSRPLVGSPALLYLNNRVRGLDASWISGDLRFHPSLHHIDDERGCRSVWPALVADVVDASKRDRVVTIHRTYITQSGEKAPVSASQVKKVMTTTVDKLGGQSIKVNTARSSLVIVTEGIEKALAWVAATQNRYAVYATLNCYNLSLFKWPKTTKAVLIGGDNDAPNLKTGLRAGQHYAEILRNRVLEAGLRVKLVIPETTGVDFDDLWNAGDDAIFGVCSQPEVYAPA